MLAQWVDNAYSVVEAEYNDFDIRDMSDVSLHGRWNAAR